MSFKRFVEFSHVWLSFFFSSYFFLVLFCSVLFYSFRFFDHMCAKPLSILLLSFFYISFSLLTCLSLSPSLFISISNIFRFFDHVFIPLVSEEVRDDSMLCLSMYNLCACKRNLTFQQKKSKKNSQSLWSVLLLSIWRWHSHVNNSINVLEISLNNRNDCTIVGY